MLLCWPVLLSVRHQNTPVFRRARYLKEPEFCTILDQRRAETMQRAAAALNEQLESAAQTIQAIMQDNTAPPQTRVNAARAVLEYAAKYDEQANLLRRVERLEQQNELN